MIPWELSTLNTINAPYVESAYLDNPALSDQNLR